MKILVAIANYGTGNRQYLDRLIAEYRSMSWDVDIVVLSNIPKDIPGVEVVVGLPDPADPWSLPFAHRPIFGERRNDYDLFIYSEDDTLVRRANIEAFFAASRVLQPNEIAGFLRSETDHAGNMFVSSVHGFFRWLPSRIVTRGGDVFAAFSNDHAACYMISRDQLAVAIASGGFLVPPHRERYDMLCAAATDVYTQCGLTRWICITRLQDFILPHLPNKYLGKMGIALDTVNAQVRTLLRIHKSGNGWRGPLFAVETGLPFGTWSKELYESPDRQLIAAIPAKTRRLLSVGCGWGATEAALKQAGVDVTAIPIDPVFGDAVDHRGVRTVVAPLDEALATLERGAFDCILLADVLHLVDDPVAWLRRLRPYLTDGTGCVVVSAPNTRDYLTLRSATGDIKTAVSRTPKSWGVNATTPGQLRRWLHAAGLVPESVIPIMSERRRRIATASLGALSSLLAYRFVGKGRVGARSQDPTRV